VVPAQEKSKAAKFIHMETRFLPYLEMVKMGYFTTKGISCPPLAYLAPHWQRGGR